MTTLLTEKQTDVAELKAAGLTRREIAGRLKLSVSAVKQRLNRARKRAVRRQPALERYARALSTGGRPVRFRPFSLLPTDNV